MKVSYFAKAIFLRYGEIGFFVSQKTILRLINE